MQKIKNITDAENQMQKIKYNRCRKLDAENRLATEKFYMTLNDPLLLSIPFIFYIFNGDFKP